MIQRFLGYEVNDYDHFMKNCKRRRKNFKSSEVFSDLVNIFMNLVILQRSL